MMETQEQKDCEGAGGRRDRLLPPGYYDTRGAARYIGRSVAAVKYHVYQGHLEPGLIGHSLVFTEEQLRDFVATRRGPGRPRKDT